MEGERGIEKKRAGRWERKIERRKAREVKREGTLSLIHTNCPGLFCHRISLPLPLSYTYSSPIYSPLASLCVPLASNPLMMVSCFVFHRPPPFPLVHNLNRPTSCTSSSHHLNYVLLSSVLLHTFLVYSCLFSALFMFLVYSCLVSVLFISLLLPLPLFRKWRWCRFLSFQGLANLLSRRFPLAYF